MNHPFTRKISEKFDREVLRWLVAQSRPLHVRLVLLSLVSTAQAALLVAFALATRSIIDMAVASNVDGIVSSSMVLALIILGELVFYVIAGGTREYIRAKQEIILRRAVLNSLLRARFRKSAAFHSGELSNRMFSDVTVVSQGVTTVFPDALAMMAQLIFVLAALAWISPELILPFLAIAVIGIVVAAGMRGPLKRFHVRVQECEGRVRVFLQEVLQHQLIVRSFGAQAASTRKADRLQEAHFHAQMRRRSFSVGSNAAFSFAFLALYLVAIVWGALALVDQTMSYGTLAATLQLVARLQSPVSSLSGAFPQLYQTLASAGRVMELCRLEDDTAVLREPNFADVEDFYSSLSAIELRNVAFSYPLHSTLNDNEANTSRQKTHGSTQLSGTYPSTALEGASEAADNAPDLICESVRIAKASFVAVVGDSGAGKSTLFKLLLGAYETAGLGFVTHDGETLPISSVPAATFAYVPQDDFLLSGTIRDNIAFARESATDAEIEHACRVACAWDFINRLPEGLHTLIGEHGLGLSQGQLQRIAIARAICSQAPILIFDEVTSALDAATEERVLDGMAALGGKTVIIATHRSAIVERCDYVLEVRDGVVAEQK